MIVFCGTYNVNATPPGLDLLRKWILRDETILPHVVCIGFQELVNLKDVKHYVNSKESEENLIKWSEAILACLRGNPQNVSFSILKSKSTVGIGLCVIVRTSLFRKIFDVTWNEISFGALGLPSKGAIAIAFRMKKSTARTREQGKEEEEDEDTDSELDPIDQDSFLNKTQSFCIVSAHLSAHQNQTEKRNEDFIQVLEKLKIPVSFNKRKSSSLGQIVDKSFNNNNNQDSDTISITSHDYLILVGDLNYRLNLPTASAAFDLIKERRVDVMMQSDQLTLQRKIDSRFGVFQEAAITFGPTYKFVKGTNKFDSLRIPAYCDRVLVKAAQVKFLDYYACPSFVSSDHKPVMCVLQLLAFPVPVGREVFTPPLESSYCDGGISIVYRAKEDYTPRENPQTFELSFKRGDEIEALGGGEEKDDFLCLGLLQGKHVGYFDVNKCDNVGSRRAKLSLKVLEMAAEIREAKHNSFVASSLGRVKDDFVDSESNAKFQRGDLVKILTREGSSFKEDFVYVVRSHDDQGFASKDKISTHGSNKVDVL